jgi:hypothetical protein
MGYYVLERELDPCGTEGQAAVVIKAPAATFWGVWKVRMLNCYPVLVTQIVP